MRRFFMGIPIFFILVLFLAFFQIFLITLKIILNSLALGYIFRYFTKKPSVALAGYGFACLYFVCPRTITSGLLGHGVLNLIKNYSQFSFFGGGHD